MRPQAAADGASFRFYRFPGALKQKPNCGGLDFGLKIVINCLFDRFVFKRSAFF